MICACLPDTKCWHCIMNKRSNQWIEKNKNNPLDEQLQKAIEQERQRCAMLATELAKSHSKGGFNALGFNIAQAILGIKH